MEEKQKSAERMIEVLCSCDTKYVVQMKPPQDGTSGIWKISGNNLALGDAGERTYQAYAVCADRTNRQLLSAVDTHVEIATRGGRVLLFAAGHSNSGKTRSIWGEANSEATQGVVHSAVAEHFKTFAEIELTIFQLQANGSMQYISVEENKGKQAIKFKQQKACISSKHWFEKPEKTMFRDRNTVLTFLRNARKEIEALSASTSENAKSTRDPFGVIIHNGKHGQFVVLDMPGREHTNRDDACRINGLYKNMFDILEKKTLGPSNTGQNHAAVSFLQHHLKTHKSLVLFCVDCTDDPRAIQNSKMTLDHLPQH